MRTLPGLLGLLSIIAVGTGALRAEIRLSDPPAHALSLLDVLADEGAKAFANVLANALENKEASGSEPHLVPFEKRKAKFRAIALDREYGGAVRQIIVYNYRLAEHHPFMYFRFTYKMTDNGWGLTGFNLNAEASQAFPPVYGID